MDLVWDGDVDGFFLQQHQQEGDHTGCATPRINMLLRNMAVERPASVMCTEDAAGMPNGTFSDPELEENVRLQAIEMLLECVEPLQLAPSKVEAWNAQATALTLQSCSGPVPTLVLTHASGQSSVDPVAAGEASAPAVMEGELRAIRSAIDKLVECSPTSMMLHGHSITPVARRLDNFRRRLLSYDAGTIAKGSKTVRDWLAFCSRNLLPNYAIPVDTDTVLWFLRECDENARLTATGAQGGASCEHATACSLRWLASVGYPFSVARDVEVRRASKNKLPKEPAWAEMWEVAIVIHLLRVATMYDGPDARFARSVAAAAYAMAAASLRFVDALRSRPPVLEGMEAFHSVAAETKGKRKSKMKPLPWWFPTSSPDPCVPDTSLALGLLEAFGMLPAESPSMFMQMVDSKGKACALDKAYCYGTTRASPAHIVASIAWLLTWTPLCMSWEEAKKAVKKQHSARHVVAELGRVLLMPKEARDELGRWKVKGYGRLSSLSNRYSRSAERIVQISLRRWVWQWVKHCLSMSADKYSIQRFPLEHFGSTPTEGSAFETRWDELQKQAVGMSREGSARRAAVLALT